jgi:hypothetical protein
MFLADCRAKERVRTTASQRHVKRRGGISSGCFSAYYDDIDQQVDPTFSEVVEGRLYKVVQLHNTLCASLETFQPSTDLAKFSENGWLCLELAV